MYLAFLEAPVTRETAETEERLKPRNNKFEQKFRHTAKGVFEPFLVHAAATYSYSATALDRVRRNSQARSQVLVAAAIRAVLRMAEIDGALGRLGRLVRGESAPGYTFGNRPDRP